MLFHRLVVAIGALASFPLGAAAQCDGPGSWAPGDGTASGMSGLIRAFFTDKAGLYAAGEFSSIGGTPANDIAFFDGSSWHALGAGMDDMGVNSLAEFEGSLIAGGHFRHAGDASVAQIARWDGTVWRSMASGISGGYEVVNAMTVYQGELIVGGCFSRAGGVQTLSTAIWSDSIWQAMPAAGFNGSIVGEVQAFIVFNGQLIAGGNFSVMGANPAVNNIARWNGTAWEALYPSAPFGTVLALAVYHGELIAAGVLQTPTSTPSIMRWDETAWVPVGGGVTDPFGGFVYGLAVVGDELIAGGRFHSMGGTPADHVARWDGTAWRALGAGTDVDVDTIYAAGAGALVTGLFLQAGGMPISHFARWSPPARACAADFDCSGAVDSQDFLNFLTAFFALDPGADFNHSGAIDSQDFFDFLTALFAGC